MDHNSVVYVGVDAAKTKHAIAIAEGSRCSYGMHPVRTAVCGGRWLFRRAAAEPQSRSAGM